MDYSKFTIEAKQPGTTNKCIVKLTGIETTDEGKTIYVFEAKVVKQGHHFPGCKVFGLHNPFIIEGATAIENPHLQPVDGHTTTCRLEANSKVTPVIKVNWTEAAASAKDNKTLLLPSKTGVLPTQIIKRNSDNPIEVVVCIDVSGSMRHHFKYGDAHSKLQMATLSAEAFIHKLRIEVDYLGVCSFSYGATHVWGDDQKTQLLGEEASKKAIEAIKTLRPYGDTHMKAGLKFSGDMLSTSESSRKTIILLSDGVDSISGPDEIQQADELKKKGIEIYTIAVGSDADKETLKKIASTETDKVKYALTVTDSTIEMDSAFTHIVQEMGVSTVHVNEAIKIASGQSISHIRPSQDFVIPEGAKEAYAAFVWDNYNTYKWVGFESPNYPFPSADGDISFGITKYAKGAQHGIAVAKEDKSVLQNKDGYVVVKLSNVVAGERYEFSLFKRTKDDKHLNFSVSFYTPYNPNANPVTTQEPVTPIEEKTEPANPPQEETTPSVEKMMKSFTGMSPKIYELLNSEGIKTPEDILRMYDNGGMEKLLEFLSNNGAPDNYLQMMYDTWYQQAEMMMAQDFDNLKHYQADIRQQYSM